VLEVRFRLATHVVGELADVVFRQGKQVALPEQTVALQFIEIVAVTVCGFRRPRLQQLTGDGEGNVVDIVDALEQGDRAMAKQHVVAQFAADVLLDDPGIALNERLEIRLLAPQFVAGRRVKRPIEVANGR
jgi:hypothetical protein